METSPAAVAKSSAVGLWLFLIFAFVWSWAIWFASGVLSRAGVGAYDFHWLVAQVGVFGPSLAALIASGVTRRGLRWNSLRILPVLILSLVVPGLLVAARAPHTATESGTVPSVVTVIVAAVVILFLSPLNRTLRSPGTGEVQEKPNGWWVFLSVVFFPVLFLVAWVLANAQGGWGVSAFDKGALGFAWIVVVAFAHTALLGGPLGEEIGWRGFLLPVLLKRNGPLAASLILAVVWGLWHLPIDLHAGFLVKGPGAVLARIIWTFPMTVLFTWFYLRCKGSMLVAVFLHTSIGMLSDFGFSKYDSALGVFFVLMSIAAVVVTATSPVFRGRSTDAGSSLSHRPL